MYIFKEALLEPAARWWRMRKCEKFLPKNKFDLVDLGSGPNAPWEERLSGKYKSYVGVDPLLIVRQSNRKHRFVKKSLKKRIELPDESTDIIISTAFLEHIEFPKEIIGESLRILRKNGRLILTTPSPAAKVILEFLAFRLGWISKREIAEHKQYFDREKLIKLFDKVKGINIHHEYFELGLNNLLVVTKKSRKGS